MLAKYGACDTPIGSTSARAVTGASVEATGVAMA